MRSQLFSLLLVLSSLSAPLYANVDFNLDSRLARQSIPLKKGWNSVFVWVKPQVTDGADAMRAVLPEAINIVAHYAQPLSTRDTADDELIVPDLSAWRTWRRASSLRNTNTLHALDHSSAYLVHADHDVSWTIEGDFADFESHVHWQSGAFSLTSFPVSVNQVSFFDYLSPQSAIDHDNIFGFQNGRWQKISPSTLIDPNQAYWVYAKRYSNFNGHFSVESMPAVLSGAHEFQGVVDITIPAFIDSVGLYIKSYPPLWAKSHTYGGGHKRKYQSLSSGLNVEVLFENDSRQQISIQADAKEEKVALQVQSQLGESRWYVLEVSK